MPFLRGVLLGLFFLVLGGAGALVASDGPRLATETQPAKSDASTSAPQTPSKATPERVARVGSPSPSSVPLPAASPVASSDNSPAEIVAVASLSDQKMTLVDPSAGKVSGTFDLGIPTRGMALGPDGHTAWVFSAKPGESDFLFADLWKRERKGSKRLHDNPSAAAFSTDGQRAYVALAGGNDSPPAPSTIVLLKTGNDEEFGHVDVGVQTPGVQILRRLQAVAVAPGPGGDVLYAAGQLSGTVWALDGGSGKLLQQIEVGGGPIAVLTDGAHQRVYVLADTINELVTIDTISQTITGRVRLPGRTTAGTVAPDGTVYVVGGDTGQLWPVRPDTGQVADAIPVGGQPSAVAVSLDGQHVYVANRGDNSLHVVDPVRKQVTARIPVAKDPVAILVVSGRPAGGATPTPTTVPAAHPTPTPTI